MAAVSFLEANWISIQEIFELVNRVLTRIFVGLWPKQRAEVLDNDVKKLAKAFDTPDDPILLMKGLSLKRGAEGTIALSYAHGEEINWEKVGSSHDCPHSKLNAFFEKAKRYAPGIVVMICARHRRDDFSFGGFCDRYCASFFDFGDKWIRASSRRWCCFCYAYFCCGS
jgi:hypothetical protein